MPQISLRIRAVWSEPLLVAWVFYECLATDRTSFGVSKRKRMLHRLVGKQEKSLFFSTLVFMSSWSILLSCVEHENFYNLRLNLYYFQGGTSFVDLLCFCSVLCLLCFVRVCLYVLFGHLLGKGWPLGSRLWCLLWVCHFPIGILGQVWYLIVSIPDLCTITYLSESTLVKMPHCWKACVTAQISCKQESIKPTPMGSTQISYWGT